MHWLLNHQPDWLMIFKGIGAVFAVSIPVAIIAGHGFAFMGGAKREWFANPLDHFDRIPASDGDK